MACLILLCQQMSEKLKIWAEIKKQAPVIIKAGGNPVDLLLWSQGKTLGKYFFQPFINFHFYQRTGY